MNPIPHLDLSGCYLALGQSEVSEKELSQACSLFDSLGVPLTEECRSFALLTKALLLIKTREYTKAKTILDEVIEISPGHGAWLLLRCNANELVNRYGAAAVDLYNAKKKTWVRNCATENSGDPDEIFRRFDKSIERGHDLGMLYRRRARYCEALGDRQSKGPKKYQYYQKAISDLVKSMEFRDSNLADALFECAQLSLKLSDEKQALMYRDALIGLDSKSLSAKVVDLQVLESKGDLKKVKEDYLGLKDLINAKQPVSRTQTELSY